MSEPVHYKFAIASQTVDCTEPPVPNQVDKCRVAVYQDPRTIAFTLVRSARDFQLSPEDAERIKKTHPNYQAPAQKLKDFLEATRDFYNQFGDRSGPTSIVGGIKILTQENIFEINDSLINFVAHGSTEPKNPSEKILQELAVGNSVAAFADPTMGILLEKTLGRIRENTRLSPAARERALWLERVFDVRKHLWNEIKPTVDSSLDLGGHLKSSTQKIIMYLFCPQILEEKGVKGGLFSDDLHDAAQKHHDILSQIDPKYSIDQNYYQYMAGVLRRLKQQVRISDKIVKGFDKRINLAIGMMEGEAKRETKRLLPYEDNLKAFKISLVLKYGDTPERELALRLLTDPITIKMEGSNPAYVVPMATIDRGLRDWVGRQSTEEKKRLATEAILYAIDQTLERGETMEVFWNGNYQRVESFFGSDNFGKSLLGGNNNRVLQSLIGWARSEAEDQGIELLPGRDKPHTHLRKWTLVAELGVGAVGMGTYTALSLKQDVFANPKTQHISRGAALGVGCAGLGAAAGNGLSHLLNVNKNAWIYDIVGSVGAGLACSAIYAATTKPGTDRPGDGGPPTPPPQRDPGDRVDKTPFGP